MRLEDFKDEDLVKISKLYLSKALYLLSIFYRETSQLLYRYDSPMNHIIEDVFEDIKSQMPSLEIFYGDFKITNHTTGTIVVYYEGNHTRLVLLLKPNSINQVLQNNLKRLMEDFLFDFEDKFRKILKTFEGDVSVFKETETMIKQNLNVELNLPHVAKYRGFDPDEPIEQYIFEAASEFSRRVGYFYLDNLIYLTKELVKDKAREMEMDVNDKKKKKKVETPELIKFPSELEFYIAMFNLKKMGLIESFPIEDLDAISKIKY